MLKRGDNLTVSEVTGGVVILAGDDGSVYKLPYPNYDDVSVTSANGKVQVRLEWIGEGCSGDYDAEMPDDEPLLRYTVYRKYEVGEKMDEHFLDDWTPVEEGQDGWRPVADGSYCTQLNANLSRETQIIAAKYILSQIEGDITNQQRCKRRMEELSWVDENMFS